MRGRRAGQRPRVGRLVAAGLVTAGLVVGFGLAAATAGSAQSSHVDNAQEGDNRGSTHQSGHGTTGSAIGGQVVGVVSSGRASVDATNTTKNSSVNSGDADGSNSVHAFVGNEVEGKPCDTSQGAGASDCPNASDVLFGGATLIAPIVQEGDNRQTIVQAATASTGNAIAGQVIGVVSAGDTRVVASNRAENTDAQSGDADAHNSIDDAQASNLVSFVPCGCPLPTDIIAGAIHAVIVQEGDNTQRLNQSAKATTGDALSGAQVIGVVTSAGGRASVDASNVGENTDARSGDADATNSIALAASGNAGLGVPACCTGAVSDISTDVLTAAIAHEGDNRQTIRQNANATTGGALSGAEVIGVVSAGDASVVASNVGKNTDAQSGDADASNSIENAQASNLVEFTPPICCPLPQDIVAPAITSVIVQEGDNRQTLSQNANATTGGALAGAQVIGVVTTGGGSASVDAKNVGEDSSATSGDADADNFIGLAVAGNTALNVPTQGSFLPADLTNVTGVIIQEGDNRETQNQTANAITGDAIAGGQVTGVVSSGATSVVVDNTGTDIDAQSGDSAFDNTVADSETGNLVEFLPSAVDVFVSGQGLGL